MKPLMTALAALFALGMLACGGPEPLVNPMGPDPVPEMEPIQAEPDYEAHQIAYETGVSSGDLVGSVGNVVLSAADFVDIEKFDNGADTSVLMEVPDAMEGGAAMNLVVFVGGLTHPDFTDGETHYYGSGVERPEGSEARAYVIGCSGPQLDNWYYDQVSDAMELKVSDLGSGDLLYEYVATFPQNYYAGNGAVIGSFIMTRSPDS